MQREIYIGDGNGLGIGSLNPAFEFLDDTEGSAKTKPSITEIGHGWYKFSVTYGTDPFDVDVVVGSIDIGVDRTDVMRYYPIRIALSDFAPLIITNNQRTSITNGVQEILEEDGSTVILTITPGLTGTNATRTPS